MFKKHVIKYLSCVFLPFILLTPLLVFVSYNNDFDISSKTYIPEDDFNKYLNKLENKFLLSKKIEELQEKLKKLKNNIDQFIEKFITLNSKITELQSKVKQLEVELKDFENKNKHLTKEINDYKTLAQFSLKLTAQKLQTTKSNILASVEYRDKVNQTIKNLSDLGVNSLATPQGIKAEYKMINYSDEDGSITLKATLYKGQIKQEVLFIVANFKNNKILFNKFLTEIKKFNVQTFDVEKKLHSDDTWLDFFKLVIKKSKSITDKDLNSDVFKQIVIYDQQKKEIGNQIITCEYTQNDEGNSLGDKKFQKSFIFSYKDLQESFTISFKKFKSDNEVLEEISKELQKEFKLSAKKQITSSKFKQKTPEEVIKFLIDKSRLPIDSSHVVTSLTFFESLISKKISLPKGITASIIAIFDSTEKYLEFRMHLFKNNFTRFPVQAYLYGFK